MNPNGSNLRSALALLAGSVTDIAGSMVGGIVVGIVLAIVLMFQGVPPAEIGARLEGPTGLVPGFIVGFCFTMIGAYVAARLARRAELLHGGVNAILASLLSRLLPFSTTLPPWLQIAFFVVNIPVGVLGGWIALTERHRRERWQTDRLQALLDDIA